ncbi:inositol polyphosphate multikinase [Neofusicoccum parvum]|uniref:Inositol polyphosphate multikinase n=1 Tax=Neofusicoccum parvum TaxID=310453 RepID=A0ACB5S346_9PEZI|nr:inositol polyphosphate multikinase [Neofusicoccum parvum]
MAPSTLDPKTLSAFENAAAGHDGVLSDPTGALVIKPCTAAEIAFYESANTSHKALARYMPTYMGTLKLNDDPETAAAAITADASAAAAAAAATPDPSGASTPAVPAIPEAGAPAAASVGTAASLALDDVGPMKGKKLATELSIVLENVAAGFRKPNILDLKLGARLWDDASTPAKRARLDKVAAETTSSSLGFRIAGMRVWQGEGAEGKGDEYAVFDAESKYKTYNKLYGRVFSAESVVDGFKEFFLVPGAGNTAKLVRPVIARLLRDVKGIQAVLEAEESKMYSASLLFVYEGDAAAAKDAEEAISKAEVEALETATASGANALNEEDDDEVELSDEEEKPKVATVKLIDFAHASWKPGEGPDENALQGIRSTVKILEDLEAELAKA